MVTPGWLICGPVTSRPCLPSGASASCQLNTHNEDTDNSLRNVPVPWVFFILIRSVLLDPTILNPKELIWKETNFVTGNKGDYLEALETLHLPSRFALQLAVYCEADRSPTQPWKKDQYPQVKNHDMLFKWNIFTFIYFTEGCSAAEDVRSSLIMHILHLFPRNRTGHSLHLDLTELVSVRIEHHFLSVFK